MEKSPASISITLYGKTTICNLEDSDLDIYELADIFKGMLIMHSFSKESIDKIIVK